MHVNSRDLGLYVANYSPNLSIRNVLKIIFCFEKLIYVQSYHSFFNLLLLMTHLYEGLNSNFRYSEKLSLESSS